VNYKLVIFSHLLTLTVVLATLTLPCERVTSLDVHGQVYVGTVETISGTTRPLPVLIYYRFNNLGDKTVDRISTIAHLGIHATIPEYKPV